MDHLMMETQLTEMSFVSYYTSSSGVDKISLLYMLDISEYTLGGGDTNILLYTL